MGSLSGKNILLVIPRNQFDEDELFKTRDFIESAGARVIVLSQNGKEATGMKKTRFQPHGMIIDWNKQEGVFGKYHAALLIGGKGAPKSLWDDTILPQILTDLYRAGKVVGAMGLSVVVLARASFLMQKEASGPNDERFLKELEAGSGYYSTEPVTCCESIITARGGEAAKEFVEAVTSALKDETPT
jgi:putative intracellular protease/amidase